ncbi:MAG: penicillin-binding protein 2 [Kiritimatiellae bacterium]|nr:penicillin-binding protein 2 [Kiritimatiellia bacterium]
MKEKEFTPLQAPPLFVLFVGSVFVVGFLVLAIALFRIQVRDVAEFTESQVKQTFRSMQVPGLRGRILDRNGVALADLRPSHDIVCNLEEFHSGSDSNKISAIEKSIESLEKVLKKESTLTRKQIVRHYHQSRAIPLVVFRNVDDEIFARFVENAYNFPAFSESVKAERVYPYGSLASHLIGYTGRDRPDSGNEFFHYYEKELKGRSGLELFYNGYLSGVTGVRNIRVDARGFKPSKAKRDLMNGDVEYREASAGPDLSLTIDLNLQKVVERELNGLTGAAVVMDPRNGEILAMVSAPSYDLNDFVPFLSMEKFERYSNDPAKPLLNRAITGTYAPGSIFKPITALAGLKHGYPADKTYDCKGIFVLGNLRLHCWDRYGHGEVGLHDAIKTSCNSFFCNLGRVVGTNDLIAAAKSFGLGKKTGIDLPGEAAGVVPDGTWKMDHWDEPWYPGDTCQMSIGQGMLLITPLQMAVMVSALANRGKIYKPYLHKKTDASQIECVSTLPFSQEHLEIVRSGMRAVVEEGTGRRVLMRYPDQSVVGADRKKRFLLKVNCAAKTGTAEIGRGVTRRKNTWVVAFAPYDNPTIALAMLVERGDSGGKTVAPKVHNILSSIFGEDEYRLMRNGELQKAGEEE